jgi:hypothetical protein
LADGASDISDFPNYAPVLRPGPRPAVRCDYFPAEMVFSSKAFGKLAKANDVKRVRR